MHESEQERYGRCAGCDAEVATTDRVYAFGEGDVLCFECGVKRGGAYDELEDRWTAVPDVRGLPVERPALSQ